MTILWERNIVSMSIDVMQEGSGAAGRDGKHFAVIEQ